MRLLPTSLMVSLLVLVALPVFGAEERSGVGIGYNTGTADFDGLPGELDFVGFSVFYKWGIKDTWGVQFSYRDMEDDEDFAPGDEIDSTQIGVHAVYMWRHGKRVRPHVKFGLAQTDVEATSSLLGSASEDDTTFSFGGGLEAGSEKIAFYGDFDYTEPEFSGVDVEVGNLTVGVIFKF